MAKILLVEDDLELAKNVCSWLEFDHHSVEHCTSGAEGLDRLKFFQFDLVVLDWELPEISGIEILKEFRRSGGKTPVLMLTGKDGVADIEAGLNTGADDYLTKPFNSRILSARIKALVRRTSAVYDEVLRAGAIELDAGKHKVTRDGQEINLQPKEFALLEFLMRNPDDVFSAETLLNRIWESDSEASPDTVRVCITRLRNKIDKDGDASVIRTVHRLGYQINT